MVKKSDKNGDGHIAFEEFLELMVVEFQKIKTKGCQDC
jgi:Ca2+-binding EF-hand superfamily protein